MVDFAASLPEHTARAGFRFVGALTGAEVLVGFAYGFTSRPGQWWYDVVLAGMPADLAATWLAEPFQFTEIAVDPDFQGRGLGSRLHDALLEGLPQRRAVLSTLQADTAAHRLYVKRGWVLLRDNFFFPGVPRRYQIMGRELGQ